MPSALVTSAEVAVESIDQPTTRREWASRTTAHYTLPSRVGCSVMSVTHSWSGPERAKQRSTRSAAVISGDIPVRREGDATVRVLVGQGSPVELGTPALILDVELSDGGQLTTPVPPQFHAFAYMLDGEAAFGANHRRATPPQAVLLGPGEELTVTDAAPGTRFLVMSGKPYHETPVFNGPFVD